MRTARPEDVALAAVNYGFGALDQSLGQDAAIDPVFAAIEAHREAWAEMNAETHWFYGKTKGRRDPEQYEVAKDAYDAHTSAFVQTEIATPEGLQSFTDYVAALQAYGRRSMPGPYPVDAWHLSDAMDTIAGAMRRLSAPRAAQP